MHTRILCLALLCFLFTQSEIYSQIVVPDNSSGSYSTGIQMAEMGTFHFKPAQPKGGVQVFTLDQMDALRVEIETMRLPDERVFWNYNEFTTIVIYSRNEITDPNFVYSTELYQ